MSGRGIVWGQNIEREKLERARELRREMTPAEIMIWERVRARRLDGLRFRRQQVIFGFVADFYCDAAGVVIEVDGASHNEIEEADAQRDAIFRSHGLLVLRFTNTAVEQSLDHVCAEIAGACRARLTISNAP